MNQKLCESIHEVSETTKTDKKVEQSAENSHEAKEMDGKPTESKIPPGKGGEKSSEKDPAKDSKKDQNKPTRMKEKTRRMKEKSVPCS